MTRPPDEPPPPPRTAGPQWWIWLGVAMFVAILAAGLLAGDWRILSNLLRLVGALLGMK